MTSQNFFILTFFLFLTFLDNDDLDQVFYLVDYFKYFKVLIDYISTTLTQSFIFLAWS